MRENYQIDGHHFNIGTIERSVGTARQFLKILFYLFIAEIRNFYIGSFGIKLVWTSRAYFRVWSLPAQLVSCKINAGLVPETWK